MRPLSPLPPGAVCAEIADYPLLFSGVLRFVPDEGMLIEFGVFQGTTLREICRLVAPRLVYGFDWFYGLPEFWKDSCPEGSFSTNGQPPRDLPANCQLIVGRVEETVGEFAAAHDEEPCAFAHFDLDLYSGTKAALMGLADNFRTGSILLFDEFDDREGGRDHEQKALAEFLYETGYRAEFIGRRLWHSYAFRLLCD